VVRRTTDIPPVQTAGCNRKSPLLARHARALRIVLIMTLVFMVAEVAGGLVSGSLALLADAAHMLTDGAAIGLALFVSWIAQRPATPEKTFGYLRLEILAALLNGCALFFIAGSIVWEAVGRLGAPPQVEPRVLFAVATAGLIVNLIAMKLLHAGHSHSLNVRGAYLHVISDMLGSVGVLLAGGIIVLTGWHAADPIVSVLIALLVLKSAWGLVRESVEVLLEATPKDISVRDVEARLIGIPGVSTVHDLHVWTVTSGVVAMSGHAVVEDPHHQQRVLDIARGALQGMGIHHVTLQVERASGQCVGADAH